MACLQAPTTMLLSTIYRSRSSNQSIDYLGLQVLIKEPNIQNVKKKGIGLLYMRTMENQHKHSLAESILTTFICENFHSLACKACLPVHYTHAL